MYVQPLTPVACALPCSRRNTPSPELSCTTGQRRQPWNVHRSAAPQQLAPPLASVFACGCHWLVTVIFCLCVGGEFSDTHVKERDTDKDTDTEQTDRERQRQTDRQTKMQAGSMFSRSGREYHHHVRKSAGANVDIQILQSELLIVADFPTSRRVACPILLHFLMSRVGWQASIRELELRRLSRKTPPHQEAQCEQ